MTVPEKRELVAKIKKIEFAMLVGRFHPPLCRVKILKDKTLYARRPGRIGKSISAKIRIYTNALHFQS